MSERLGYSLSEAATMLGYKSPSTLYECAYLPPGHPHHIPTFSIPQHRGRLRIPAAWLYAEIARQTQGMCGALPDMKSATPTHAGGRPRVQKTSAEFAMAGGDSDSKEPK